MSERSPKWRENSWKPGQSGNPNGRSSYAAVQELCRRYTIDAVTGLVHVARHGEDSPRANACRILLNIGYPGIERAEGGGGEQSALHLHLMAVQSVVLPTVDHLTGEPEIQPPEQLDGEALEARFDVPGLLPAPREEAPLDALELWDAARARLAAREASGEPDPPMTAPEASGVSTTQAEPITPPQEDEPCTPSK